MNGLLTHRHQRLLDTRGCITITLRTLTGHGTYRWQKHQTSFARSFHDAHEDYIAVHPSAIDNMLTCSFCCPYGHPRQSHSPPFTLTALTSRIWCSTCRHSFASAKWVCPCHLPWQICTLHSIAKLPEGRTKRTRTQSAVVPMDDEAASKRLRTIEPMHFYKRPLIGPKLQAKFPKLTVLR